MGEMCSLFLVPVSTLASAFWINRRLFRELLELTYNNELLKSNLEVTSFIVLSVSAK